jgi:RNA polymerase sigma-70 factor (ECF subfamily)
MSDFGDLSPAELRRCRELAAPSWEATRRSLLTRLKDLGDSQGWQRFSDTYSGVIRSLAVKAGCSPTEADEALQESLISVAREMPDFRYDPARGSFKSWLFCIVRRRIADQFRRRARQQRTEAEAAAELEDLPDPATDPLNALWEVEWRQHRLHLAVEQVKQKISPAQWQMFDLSTLQEWPTERICALLGVNRAQIYMAKMRVGRLLKQEHTAMIQAESGGQATP